MSRETIPKRVYCKRAVFLDSSDKITFQSQLSEALQKLKKMGERKETLGEDARYVRAIIYHRSYANMLFGIMASYEKGTHHLTVNDDDNAEMLTVEQVEPKGSDQSKRQEFLEGICYFCVFNNHVVIAPSRALGAKPMEQYLNWLLCQAGLLSESNRVGFADQIIQATKNRIKSSHVKQVEIGAPLLDFSQSQEIASGKAIQDIRLDGIGLNILRQIFGSDKLSQMNLIDAVDGNIEVTLKIRYNRATTEKAHNVLDNIALAVRNLDEDEVKITLDGGGTVKGSDLKLFTLLSVQASNGIPNPDQLFEKMREWLLQQIENQIVEP